MAKASLLIAAWLLALPLAWGIHINEIMYNPIGDDNNKEFVEVMGTDNLSGYVIGDLGANDSLALLQYVPGNFSLIVEEGFNFSGINCSVYSVGATIGNNLNNEADTVFLYYEGILVYSVSYTSALANNNGHSLELVVGEWRESCSIGGSPGKENCIGILANQSQGQSIENQTNGSIDGLNDDNITGSNNNTYINYNNSPINDNSNLSINDSLNNNSLNTTIVNITIVNTTVLNATTVNTTNQENNSQEQNTSIEMNNSTGEEDVDYNNTCLVVLNLSTDKTIYTEGESVQIKNTLNTNAYAYVIEYWVEDLFGNEAKKKLNTTNTNTKSYKPSLGENDKAFIIKNRLAFVDCDNTNPVAENEKLVVVKKSSELSEEEAESQRLANESSISIAKVNLPSSGELSFGDELKVKLSLYKGDTGKTLVTAYVQGDDGKKVSEATDFYLEKKYSGYELSIKVVLKPDCKLASDEYTLVVDGLGLRAEEKIYINKNNGKECVEEPTSQATKQASTSQQTAASQNTAKATASLSKIVSFYTRTQNYKEKIMLYANIQADSSHTVVLSSGMEEQIFEINGSAKLGLNASAQPGTNEYRLELRKNSQIVDYKNLTVELKGGEKKELANSTIINSEANHSLSQGKKYDEEPEKQAEEEVSITGSVVYESDNMKIAKKAPYLVVPIAILAIVGLVLSRKKQVKR